MVKNGRGIASEVHAGPEGQAQQMDREAVTYFFKGILGQAMATSPGPGKLVRDKGSRPRRSTIWRSTVKLAVQ
jgi:hypothetical protein